MKQTYRSNDKQNKSYRRPAPSAMVLIILLLTSLILPTHQLSLGTVINALSIPSSSRKVETTTPTITTSTITNTVVKLTVPSLRLTMASDRSINGIYAAQDPKSIPSGFIKSCSKAGGFAPRPLWDEITNGITPWFLHDNGCFIYLNCQDGRWWMDRWDGNPLFLADPEGSLLLPPMEGWVGLTGGRSGVPRVGYL